MKDDSCFIVFLKKGKVMRMHDNIILFNHQDGLFLVRGRRDEIFASENSMCDIWDVTREFLYQFILLLDNDIFMIPAKIDTPEYIIQPCPEGGIYREIIQELRKSDIADGVGAQGVRRHFLLMTLMSSFIENKDFVPLLRYVLKKNMREQVMVIISKDISNNWSIGKVADKLCVSPSLLKKKLKNENTNYTRVVLECRMQKAKELLNLQQMSVKQVAFLCGYQSVAYFIAVFRNYYGCTPCEYSIKKVS